MDTTSTSSTASQTTTTATHAMPAIPFFGMHRLIGAGIGAAAGFGFMKYRKSKSMAVIAGATIAGAVAGFAIVYMIEEMKPKPVEPK